MNKHKMELITHFLIDRKRCFILSKIEILLLFNEIRCVHFQENHWSGLPYLAWWYSICMELSALP